MNDDHEQPGIPPAPAPGPGPGDAAPVDAETPSTETETETGPTLTSGEGPPESTEPTLPATSPLPPPIPPPLAPPTDASTQAQPGWPLPPVEATATPPAPPSTAETPLPYTYPAYGAPPDPSTAAASSGTGQGQGQGQGRRWLAVAVVAAVIGAGVGAGVTALTDNNNSGGDNVTIHESNATSGAAVLSGNVTIPELVRKVNPAVVSIDVKSGQSEDQGTGMIITPDGEVVTNNHVIELFNQGGGTGTITVTEFGQKTSTPATLIGYNTQQDVALLRINGASNLKTITFGSSAKTQVGDAVVAIGNALGLAAGTPTVTQGIISALGRSVTAGGAGTTSENLSDLIQTDAAINPGNSGGPLIDTNGQVIGMNTAVAGTSNDGTSAQNIGFAIPIATVQQLLPQLEKGGPASNSGGYLGVDITTLTAALRQQYGFTPTSGAVILNVVTGSPAAKAGLQQGDVVVDIDGKAIASAEDLQSTVQKDKAGQTVQVTYYVGDNKRTSAVTLGTQAQAQQQAAQQNQTQTNPFGAGGFPGG